MGSEPDADPRDSTLRLTDPKAMRAVAHPVRMALLDLFNVHPTLTATQASELLGESPANCAFHLRTLAKYGYVEEAGGGRGRERPWAAAHRSISLTERGLEPRAALAAKSLADFWHERVLDRIRLALARHTWPAGWEHETESSVHVAYLTGEETAQVAREMSDIIKRYENRRYDPSIRPAGSLPVEFSIFGYPRTDLTPSDEKTGE